MKAALSETPTVSNIITKTFTGKLIGASKRITVAMVLVIGFSANARLKPSKFSDLIAESDLILDASPKRIERTGLLAGEATLKILRVVRGTFDGSEITIKWSDEVHDQAIVSLEADYFLFLKKDKDGYTGTHYGRSYWSILGRITDPKKADLDSVSRVLTFPFGVVQLSSEEKKQLLPQTKGRSNATLTVKHLVEYINNAKPRPGSVRLSQ